MPTESLVSVILIFLDEEKFIQEAIDSVFAQNYENWELFLVDDGSTDGSMEIARRCAGQHPGRVRYLEHQGRANRGMSASRNFGIRHSQGEYLAFIDADDVWLPHKLEQQVAILDREREAGMVWGPTLYWFSWTGEESDLLADFVSPLPGPANRLVLPPELLIRCAPLGQLPASATCSLMVRRELAEKVGGFEDSFRGWGEDQVFLAKVHLESKVYISDNCSARYRMHRDSCVARTAEGLQEREAKLTVLNWFDDYLRRRGSSDSQVQRALQKAFRPLCHPHAHALAEGWRSLAGRLRAASREHRTLRQIRRSQNRRTAKGWIRTNPNPVPLLDYRFDTGQTTVRWGSSGTDAVEVRIDRPDGPLFSCGGPEGEKETGRWVRDGMGFFLLDASEGREPTSDKVLAAVRVKVQKPRRNKRAVVSASTKGGQGLHGSALILMYHRVADVESDPWSLAVHPRRFAEHLEAIRQTGHPLSLLQLSGTEPRNVPSAAVAITLDDGYADNLHEAQPLLERHDVPATVFVVSGAVGGRAAFWWDELEELLLHPGSVPRQLTLAINGSLHHWNLGSAARYTAGDWHSHRGWLATSSTDPTPRHRLYRHLYRLLQTLGERERKEVLERLREQVVPGTDRSQTSGRPLTAQELTKLADSALITIGAHTVTHPFLPKLPAARQAAEIRNSKADLEAAIGSAVESFSYPYGAFTDQTAEIVRDAGFRCACAGGDWSGDDPFRLPRFVVKDWDGEEFTKRLSDCRMRRTV